MNVQQALSNHEKILKTSHQIYLSRLSLSGFSFFSSADLYATISSGTDELGVKITLSPKETNIIYNYPRKQVCNFIYKS